MIKDDNWIKGVIMKRRALAYFSLGLLVGYVAIPKLKLLICILTAIGIFIGGIYIGQTDTFRGLLYAKI